MGGRAQPRTPPHDDIGEQTHDGNCVSSLVCFALVVMLSCCLSRLSSSLTCCCCLATRPMFRCCCCHDRFTNIKGCCCSQIHSVVVVASRHFDEHFDQHAGCPTRKWCWSTSERRPSTLKSEYKTASRGVGGAGLRASSVAPHLRCIGEDHGDGQSPHCCCCCCCCCCLDMLTVVVVATCC